MQKALFLDRDGIINVDYGYVHEIQKFQFTHGIFELLHLFKKQNYLFFIVTNQSGIGRGYYTIDEFNTLTSWMLEELNTQGIEIEKVEFCPHSPEANCQCRKPKTGMVDSILKEYTIDLDNSWLIGDKQSDIDLAHNSNIAHTIAIGKREIINSKYKFKSILKCREFFETFSWSNLTS